jgi:hypothetical protein
MQIYEVQIYSYWFWLIHTWKQEQQKTSHRLMDGVNYLLNLHTSQTPTTSARRHHGTSASPMDGSHPLAANQM